jgi:membrane protease YdiL (CAAX protease family)
MGILPERTARFEAFIAPARARPALWRLAAGAVLAAAVWLAAAFVLLPLAARVSTAPERLFLHAYLASFACLILGTVAAARALQRRGPATLIGPGGFRPRDFALGIAAVVLLGALAGLTLSGLTPPVRQMSLAAWAAWLPLALPALLVQTAAEEIAFRGYLLQGLAARFRSRWIWWLLPALGFGALHWNPAEFGRNAWLVALSTAVIGLILADVTIRTGNLSAAIGLHFANNVASLLVVALPSPLAGLSLYLAGIDPADADALRPLLLADLATTLAAFAAWLALCHGRRRLHSEGRGSI